MKIDIDNFSPVHHVDLGFDLNLKTQEIVDSKGKKLGKVIAQQNNVGIALVDLARLNKNGPNHEYRLLGDFRTYLWQPLWLEMALKPSEELQDDSEQEDQLDIKTGLVDEKTGKPPGI